MSPPKEPEQTICDGQLVLGEVYLAGDKFTAKDRDGNSLGTFASIEAARSAIIQHRMAERREASRQ